MKEILLQEDDRSVFGSPISPEEYLYYTEHKDAMRTVWKEQGHLFWLNTLTKFRVYVVKHGSLSPFNTMVSNGALDYPFIVIAKKMTGSFSDISELLTDVSIVTRNMHLTGNMLKPTCAYDPFVNPTTRNSFRNLFGPPDSKIRILRTFIFSQVFCNWAGTLVRLLRLWKVAPPVLPAPGQWSPPSSYVRQTPLRTGLFEQYLKNSWGSQIFEVCGAPPQQLVWWKALRPGGPTELQPMQEYNALSVVFDCLVDVAGDDLANSAESGDSNKNKGKGKKAPQKQDMAPQPASEGKKKRKKNKKGKSNGETKTDGKTEAKPKPSQPPVAIQPFPPTPPAVSDATLDWHEYVTALLGTECLLQNQVQGGALLLGWAALTVADLSGHVSHMSMDMRDNIKIKHELIRDYWSRATKKLHIKGNSATVALREERDQLSSRINTACTLVAAVTALRHLPGVDPESDMQRIKSGVRRALQSPLLRLYPLLYQYAASETVPGDPRVVYPDFSRTRYILRKGVSLLNTTPPSDHNSLNREVALALEWHSELLRLPEEASEHARLQLRPGGVLNSRLAEHRIYALDAESKLKGLDLSLPDTMASMEQVFRAVRDVSGGEEGPVPPRPARLLPHTGQSLVDAYWSRLGAMAFVTDLLCALPVSEAVNDILQNFKAVDLNALFVAITELQLAQWRWLYPRAELELPRRPAFIRPAGLTLMTDYLNYVDAKLCGSHQALSALYFAIRGAVSKKGHSMRDEVELWTSVHYFGDDCGPNAGGESDNCRDCRRHAIDMANRRLLRVVNLLTDLSLRSGAPINRIVESLHALPCFLVAVQDYKSQPSKSAWQAIEKMTEDIMKISQGGDPEVRDQLQQVVNDFSRGGGPSGIPSPRQLGNREMNTREFMLAACNELSVTIIGKLEKKQRPIPETVCEKALDMATEQLLLNKPLSSPVPSPAEEPGGQRQFCQIPGEIWASLLSSYDASEDWRRELHEPAKAVKALTAPRRLPPDLMARQKCTERAGKGDEPRIPCDHEGPELLLCNVLRAIRNVSLTAQAAKVTSAATGRLNVHWSMFHLLRDCWLPYLLAADRVFRGKPVSNKPYTQHASAIVECGDWLEDGLVSLYKARTKFGPGRMLRFDRSWINADSSLKPDSTICRTLSWTQACDLHMDMTRRIVKALWSLRTRLPPVTEAGCEVHPAPLALLERVETGSLLLLTAFLAYRDGRSARHLVDVTELQPLVAPAVDAYGWLGLVDHFVPEPPSGMLSREQMDELLADTEHAFTMYERSLRNGSLLEFLCLRPAHAVPIQLAITANIRRDVASLAALRKAVSKDSGMVINLPPIAELRGRAARDHALPMEWLVRLQQVRRILLSSARPALLDSALLCAGYRAECTAETLPGLPSFYGPENMFESLLLSSDCPVNAEAFCNHVFDLGQHVIKYHAALKSNFYLNQNDHTYPDRRFFLDKLEPKNSREVPMTEEDRKTDDWAAAHVSNHAADGRREQRRNTNSGASDQTSDTQLATMERLSRELEGLLLSADHLKDIPEEPLPPSLVTRAGRRAGRISETVQLLPAGAVREAAATLAGTVQRALEPQLTGKKGRRKARTVAGSEMSVVETCLSTLSSVLSQHALTPDPASSDSDPDPEPAGAAAALRVCGFCDRRERTPGAFELCSLCVTGGAEEPRVYCGKACQTDDWELGHWEDHK